MTPRARVTLTLVVVAAAGAGAALGGAGSPLPGWAMVGLLGAAVVAALVLDRSAFGEPGSVAAAEIAALTARLERDGARAAEDRERLKREVAQRAEAQEALAVARDQALAVARAKSAFLANMSHELRTPLNAIMGYAQLLQEDARADGSTAAVEDLEKIQRAGAHLLELIADILDLTKIEAGHVKVHLEEIDVVAFCEQVLSTIRPLADVNHNRLESRFASDLGKLVIDARKLRQSLFNLLSNACKFTQSGTVILEVSRYREGGAPWIRFAVHDDGIGLDPDQQDAIFEEFVQADDSVARRYGGTGLGLPISRRLCQVLGGDIRVESARGAGSTFEILLPADEVPDLAPAPERRSFPRDPTPSGSTRGDRGGPLALVIDDDEEMRVRIAEALAADGFRVRVAADGGSGIELARSHPPDVVVLDVVMPEMDGWKILRVLKRDPQLAVVPVLMLAIADRKGVSLGVVDYLVKPVSRERLVDALARVGIAPSAGPVLVVDDDATVREVCRRMLTASGWTVREAGDGKAALDSIQEQRPSAILLDLMMPGVDGFQVLAALQDSPRFSGIPVLVQSAMDIPPRLTRGLQGRVADAIAHRGTTREELARQVRGLLELHR